MTDTKDLRESCLYELSKFEGFGWYLFIQKKKF